MATFFDHRLVLAYALLKNGKNVGRALIARSESGATFYAFIQLYSGNCLTGSYVDGMGKAGGYGYDKASTALANAVQDAGLSDIIHIHAGAGAIMRDLSASVDVIAVC